MMKPRIENVPHVEAEMVEEILPSRALRPTAYFDIDDVYVQRAVVIEEVPTVIVQDAKFIKQNPAYVKSVVATTQVDSVAVPRQVTPRVTKLQPVPEPPILDKENKAIRKKLVVKRGHHSLFAQLKEARWLSTKAHFNKGVARIYDNYEHIAMIQLNDYDYLQVALAARDGVKILVLKTMKYAWDIDEMIVRHTISIPMKTPFREPLKEFIQVLCDIPLELKDFPILNEANMIFSGAKENRRGNYKDFKLGSGSTTVLASIDSKRERKRDQDEEAVSTTGVLRWGDHNQRKLLGLGEWQSAAGQHSPGDNGSSE